MVFVLNEDIPKSTILYFSKEGFKSQTLYYSDDDSLMVELSELHVNIDEWKYPPLIINYQLIRR